MKGSGTVRREGLVSKLRMSFVFSAGTQEEKRQSETEQRNKPKASSKISVLESRPWPDKNTHTQNQFVLPGKGKKEGKPNNPQQLLPCSSPTQLNSQTSKHSLKGKYYSLTL